MEPTYIAEGARRLTIAIIMLTHIQFAAFLIGIFGLGVGFEFFGMINPGSRQRFDRLAHGLARTAVLIYSTGSVIAIIFLLVMVLLWPTFWAVIVRITIWPVILESITFILTILYLFPWYYTWNALSRFKVAHVSLGFALVVVAQIQQSMIDVMASYMLTPAPPDNILRIFFNATAIPLDLHRIVGDLSFAGFVIAGFAAWKSLRVKDGQERSYFEWAGNVGLLAGIGFLFLQPAIGLAYVEEIRANAPGAFTLMMRGANSWVFLVQSFFLAVLFFLSVLYMYYQAKRRGTRGVALLRVLLIIVGLSGLLLIQPYVIGPSQDRPWINWVNPLGAMQPWKYIAMAGISLGSIGAVISYLGLLGKNRRWRPELPLHRRAQYTLLSLAIFSSAMMAIMGYIRESSRVPFLINYDRTISDPEQYPPLPPEVAPVSQSQGGGTANGAQAQGGTR